MNQTFSITIGNQQQWNSQLLFFFHSILMPKNAMINQYQSSVDIDNQLID